MLSKKDQARELHIDTIARKDWAKSAATYRNEKRIAKNNYKANWQKMKNEYKSNNKQLKSNRNAADILVFNPATRRRAAYYMTVDKMKMAEAKKKAYKDAGRNTLIALGIIGAGYAINKVK